MTDYQLIETSLKWSSGGTGWEKGNSAHKQTGWEGVLKLYIRCLSHCRSLLWILPWKAPLPCPVEGANGHLLHCCLFCTGLVKCQHSCIPDYFFFFSIKNSLLRAAVFFKDSKYMVMVLIMIWITVVALMAKCKSLPKIMHVFYNTCCSPDSWGKMNSISTWNNSSLHFIQYHLS